MSEPKDAATQLIPPAGNRRQSTVSDTAAVSMTTAGLAAWMLWVFQCLHAHELLIPSDECCFFMAALILPVLQAYRDRVRRKLEEST